jgi:hypothetical protein
MTPVAPDEILTSLNTEGERAREGEGEKKKKTIGLRMTDERHTPPNPPQWGNEFNNSPPWRGVACGGEGAFQFLKAQHIEQNPDTFLRAK